MSDVAAAIVAALGVLGLLIGSFLNVVIARVPEHRSVIHPASACPDCGSQLRWRDNIPVLSWLVLRGRCRTCGGVISWQYPLVELANATLWVALAYWSLFVVEQASLLPLLLTLASAGLALAVIDARTQRLPDAIVLPLYPIAVVGLAASQLVTGVGHWLPALGGALLWISVIGGLWLLTAGRGMGFGDVKLAPILGATLGWLGMEYAAVGLFAGFLVGAVVGIVYLISGRAQRGSRLAFGPFLLIGSLLGLLIAEPVWGAYSDLMGL